MVKILDLGIARLHYETVGKADNLLTQLGTAMGTPDYMAPEQIVDTHQVTIRADIYSLGCTFFHMLIGRPPFAEGTDEQKLPGTLNERLPPWILCARNRSGTRSDRANHAGEESTGPLSNAGAGHGRTGAVLSGYSRPP